MRKGNFGGKVMMLPETAAEVEEMGWETYDSRWTKGYISRKSKPVDWPICTAGGSRRGALFYRHPSWESTHYCYRTYIRPGKQAQSV